MAEYYQGKPYPIYVVLTCTTERVDETEVEIENIEEDFQGRDVVTFQCPACGDTHKSYRIG